MTKEGSFSIESCIHVRQIPTLSLSALDFAAVNNSISTIGLTTRATMSFYLQCPIIIVQQHVLKKLYCCVCGFAWISWLHEKTYKARIIFTYSNSSNGEARHLQFNAYCLFNYIIIVFLIQITMKRFNASSLYYLSSYYMTWKEHDSKQCRL